MPSLTVPPFFSRRHAPTFASPLPARRREILPPDAAPRLRPACDAVPSMRHRIRARCASRHRPTCNLSYLRTMRPARLRPRCKFSETFCPTFRLARQTSRLHDSQAHVRR
jgi:hypothetical protein